VHHAGCKIAESLGFRRTLLARRLHSAYDMRPLVQRLAAILLLVVVAAVVPARAAAVTVDDVVSLSRAGVTDAVILALIDRDKTIFTIEPEQLIALKSQVSEAVILAMLKSGRDEGERAAQAASDLNAGFIMSSLSPAPDVVVVGHGPDVPNGGYGGYSNGIYGVPPVAGLITVPYAVGGGFGGRRRHGSPAVNAAPVAAEGRTFLSPFAAPYNSPFGVSAAPVVRPVQAPPAPSLCIAQVSGVNSLHPLSFVTQCPR